MTQQRNHRCYPHTALSARHTHTIALRITLIAFAFGLLLAVPISGGRIFIAMIMLDGLGGWDLPLGPKVVYIH